LKISVAHKIFEVWLFPELSVLLLSHTVAGIAGGVPPSQPDHYLRQQQHRGPGKLARFKWLLKVQSRQVRGAK